MFRLILVALAGLYAVLHIFGDPERRPVEVAADDVAAIPSLSLANFVEPDVDETGLPPLAISEEEAIRIALEASKAARKGPRFPTANIATAPVVEPAAAEFRYVSGTKVNLRQGPGTANAVVAQLARGTEAEVLDSQNGWHQIRTVDGAVSGWIFGGFLSDRRPG